MRNDKKIKCWYCGKVHLYLTRHSLIGSHQPPFKWVGRTCHDKIHNIKRRKTHINRKVNKGVKYRRYKKQ